MPRKNRHVKHTPFAMPNREEGKTRFGSQQAAQAAADYQMALKPDLELYVYKSDLNGGWYLTRKKPSTP